ncbi:phosphatase PAP2 family protein [Oxalobacteraceae bacterium]|nr:phosphatase PAP2 family protein [Oxalobacteraceae bacterium]
MNWWHGLTLLGSLAVTGPVGIAIAVWLMMGKSWRLAAQWCLLFGGAMALVVATKVAFIGWGIGIESVEFAGISGHAMRACAVFPVAAFLAFRHTGKRLHWIAVALGVVLALLISYSRIVVHAHSVSEVLSGAPLGLLVAAAFLWLASDADHLAMSRVLVVLCIPVLLVLPHVEPIPTEQWMEDLALTLSGHERPFTRLEWPNSRQSVQLRFMQQLRARQMEQQMRQRMQRGVVQPGPRPPWRTPDPQQVLR